MITIDERDDVKVPTPDANQVTLFYTDQALRFKDENGDVWTLTKQEDLDAIAATEPKVYVALLTQSGTDAPVATVLKNTLGGTVVWTYDSVGQYNGTLAGAFILNKTVVFHNLPFQQSSDEILIKVVTNGEDIIRVNVVNDAFAAFNGVDSLCIKIEVYP